LKIEETEWYHDSQSLKEDIYAAIVQAIAIVLLPCFSCYLLAVIVQAIATAGLPCFSRTSIGTAARDTVIAVCCTKFSVSNDD
jgi:hypothetical protein